MYTRRPTHTLLVDTRTGTLGGIFQIHHEVQGKIGIGEKRSPYITTTDDPQILEIEIK